MKKLIKLIIVSLLCAVLFQVPTSFVSADDSNLNQQPTSSEQATSSVAKNNNSQSLQDIQGDKENESNNNSSQVANSGSANKDSDQNQTDSSKAQKLIGPQDDTSVPTHEPAGLQGPSPIGISFIIPLADGFVLQPQKVQNIVMGQKPDLAAIVAFFRLNPLFTGDGSYEVQRYDYNPNSSTSDVNGFTTTEKVSGSATIPLITGRSKVNPNVSALTNPGTYYYQIKWSAYGSLGAIGGKYTFYSQPIKVIVHKDAVPANTLSVNSDKKIVFAGVDSTGNDLPLNYGVHGLTTPTNSTDLVNWTKNTNVKYELSSGTDNSFTIPNSVVTGAQSPINSDTDPNHAGVPITLSAQAGSANGSTTVYAGGLAAQRVEQGNSAIKWPVQGLDALDSHATNITYQWRFFDANGNQVNDITGVDNVSGSLSSWNDLNATKELTINPGKFMDNAAKASQAGKPYSAQLRLNFDIVYGSDRNQKGLTINTNKGNLYVDKPSPKLALTSVPSFNFGSVKAPQIYNGVSGIAGKSDGNLSVTANNVTSWTLSVNRDDFKSTNGNTIKNSKLSIYDSTNKISADILPDSNAITVISNNGAKDGGDWLLKSDLSIDANPNATLSDNQNYTSQITWTLSGPSPS